MATKLFTAQRASGNAVFGPQTYASAPYARTRGFARMLFALGSTGEAGPAPAPAPTPTPAPPPPAPAPAPAAPTNGLPAGFTLLSPVTQANAPYTIGHAFVKGNVPSGSGLLVGGAFGQITVKSTWPDGSVRFALIAGTASLTANVPLAVTVGLGTTAAGTALTTTDLKATGITASIAAGPFGTVSWATTDWDSPFSVSGAAAWVSGNRMSSWIYRKPVGSDPHLVAWLEVRLYSTGAVEVLPWIENGYIAVASPTSKSATYVFTLGGTSRFSRVIDLPSHCRTPLLFGSALSHWLGTDPQVTFHHDATYLQSTSMVPTYRAQVPTNGLAVVGGGYDPWTIYHIPPTTSFTPLQISNWTYSGDAMGSTAYAAPIGLLPEHDVLCLTCTAPTLSTSVQMNSYSAGRYPTHVRDEATNRPLSFASWPHLAVTADNSSTGQALAVASGTNPPVWDVPHHPSLGFFAYLLTGRYYHLEEIQFAATTNYLYQVDTTRGLSNGTFQSGVGACTVRGAAWALRTLAQAAAITPDTHPLRSDFLNSLAANIDFYHALYVAQTNNPYGWVSQYGPGYTPGTGVFSDAWWQQDFFTAVVGYAKAMEPGIPSGSVTRLSAFFTWKAQSVVGRLGGLSSTEWLFSDAAEYYGPISPSETPDFVTGTGPWFASWGAAYNAAFGHPNPGVAADLRGGNFPDPTSYWGILGAALSYAVQHGVAGAQAGFDRMTSAPSWPTLAANYNVDCVWSVMPRGTDLPLWRRTMAPGDAKELTNSAMSYNPPALFPGPGFGTVSSLMDAWGGGAYDRVNDVWYNAGGSGHTDGIWNGLMAQDYKVDAPHFTELLTSSDLPDYGRNIAPPNPWNLPRLPTGRPVAIHPYYSLHFANGYVMRVGLGGIGNSGNQFAVIDGINVSTLTWSAPGFFPNLPTFGTDSAECQDEVTGDVYIFNDNIAVWKWSRTDNTITTVSAAGVPIPNTMNRAASAVDYTRNRILLCNSHGSFIFNRANGIITPVTLTGSYVSQVQQDVQGMEYIAKIDAFLVVGQAAGLPIYKIDAGTLDTSLMPGTGSTAAPAITGVGNTSGGPYNKPRYSPNFGCMIIPRGYVQNTWVYRIH